jgi:pimeloyl-ACP methyl ester carboxylesterase
MRIVLLHGRAAEMDIPELMAADYSAALRYGLRRIGATDDADSVDIRFAFYGDIWRPDEHQPLPDIQPAEIQEAFPGLSDVSLFLDEHLGLGEALLDRLLRDVDGYFSEPALRTPTNQRLIDAITADGGPGKGAIVVGFSMGSFVAYDTLRADTSLPVKALITVGSPLAMPSFHKRIRENSPIKPPKLPTPFPPQLGMWVNVWTRDDVGTAGHVDMAARYPSKDPVALHVQDVETWGRPASPANPVGAHNALDYLSSRVFAKAVRTAIAMIEAAP